MRTPVGSSKRIARSLRHSSPAWLPSGVTFTSAADCPFTTVPWAIQNAAINDPAITSERTRMNPSVPPCPPSPPGPPGLPDPPDLPDPHGLPVFHGPQHLPR